MYIFSYKLAFLVSFLLHWHNVSFIAYHNILRKFNPIMRKVTLIRTLPVLLSLLLAGGMLMAQNARKSVEIPVSLLEAPRQDQSAVDARAAKLEAARAAKMAKAVDVKALVKELKANAGNRAYDQEATFQQIRQSPLFMYPFKHYDPDFPIVIRTGDQAVDNAAYNAAKRAWRAAQKN